MSVTNKGVSNCRFDELAFRWIVVQWIVVR